MENSADLLINWLQDYKQREDNDLIPDLETLSIDIIMSHYNLLSNFDFGDGENILHIAIFCDHPTIIRHLINVLPAQALIDLLTMKDDDGHTAIHDAARYNSDEILTEILSSVRAAGFATLQLLLTPDSDGWPAAHEAAMTGNYQVMESMLESLTDSDERLQLLMSIASGLTVLQRAVLNDRVQTVRSLQKYMPRDLWYQLMKAQDIDSWTALHSAALWDSTDMVRTLMDPLTDEQQLEMLKLRDNEGLTAKDYAVSEGHTEVSDLLEEITTTFMISMFAVTAEKDEKQRLLEKLIDQPLSSQQVRDLYPLSNQYIIPRNQKNVRQQALIFYNEHDREGAEEEADNLSQSLIIAGCDVIKRVWSEVSQLQSMITGDLLQTYDTSSVLILCLMSHGSMGCLQGIDGMVSINTILKQVCDYIPHDLPLVVVVQACQGSRYGIQLQVPQVTEPQVSNSGVTQIAQATDPSVHMSVSDEDMKIDVTRPHTVLLQATVTGRLAYRGVYTTALADQLRRSNGKISIYEIHEQSVMEVIRKYGLVQIPKICGVLMKKLLLPGAVSNS